MRGVVSDAVHAPQSRRGRGDVSIYDLLRTRCTIRTSGSLEAPRVPSQSRTSPRPPFQDSFAPSGARSRRACAYMDLCRRFSPDATGVSATGWCNGRTSFPSRGPFRLSGRALPVEIGVSDLRILIGIDAIVDVVPGWMCARCTTRFQRRVTMRKTLNAITAHSMPDGY